MGTELHDLISGVGVFVGQHPSLIGLTLFLLACSEAVIGVGSPLPGAVIFIIATVAGAAGTGPWSMVWWAALGAMTGDGISYWRGRAHGKAMTSWPWARSRPHFLRRGEAFIDRHGVKSVLLARFLSTQRVAVPMAAGNLGMKPARFLFADGVSAFLWAVVHIFPAVALGLTYAALGEVSAQLALLLVAVLLAAAGLLWLVRLLVVWLIPHLVGFYRRVVAWLAARPDRFSRTVAHLLDPDRPGLATFVLWGVVLIGGVAGFLAVLEDLVRGEPLVRADVAISHFVQGLRSDPLDAFMVRVTAMGDTVTVAATSLALVVILAWLRQWRTALAAFVTIVCATVSVDLIKLILHKPRPIAIYSGAGSYSFPSGHTTMTTVIFGILAALVSRRLSTRGKVVVLFLYLLWVAMIGTSRIWLAAHWPSDVLGGMLFGLALVALFALFLGRFPPRPGGEVTLAIGTLAVFLLVGGAHAVASFDRNFARYEPRRTVKTMDLTMWLNGGWKRLPLWRIDLDGDREESFIMQWAAPRRVIVRTLASAGWHETPAFTWRDGLRLLIPGERLDDVAPLPLMHNGRLPVMTFARHSRNAEESATDRLVLRFWHSGYDIATCGRRMPLYLASVRREVMQAPLAWLSVLRERTGPEIGAELRKLPGARVAGGLVLLHSEEIGALCDAGQTGR